MPRRSERHLANGLALQLAAMAIPFVLATVALGPLSGLLTGPQLSAAAAGAFAVACWLGLGRLGIDETDFLMASVIGPVSVFLGVVLVRAALWQLLNFVEGWPERYLGLWAYLWDVLGFVAPGDRGLLVFVGLFGAAGFVGVGLRRQVPVGRSLQGPSPRE